MASADEADLSALGHPKVECTSASISKSSAPSRGFVLPQGEDQIDHFEKAHASLLVQLCSFWSWNKHLQILYQLLGNHPACGITVLLHMGGNVSKFDDRRGSAQLQLSQILDVCCLVALEAICSTFKLSSDNGKAIIHQVPKDCSTQMIPTWVSNGPVEEMEQRRSSQDGEGPERSAIILAGWRWQKDQCIQCIRSAVVTMTNQGQATHICLLLNLQSMPEHGFQWHQPYFLELSP